MKSIVYEDKFLNAQGQPCFIPDPDVLKQREAQAKGQDIPAVEVTFASLVIFFVDNIPHDRTRKITMQDAGNAYAVIKAFRNIHDGMVELEDTVYKWLLDTIEIDGTAALRGAASVVLKERVQNLVKE